MATQVEKTSGLGLNPTEAPAEASGLTASTSDPPWDSVAFSDEEIYSFLNELAVPPDDPPLLLVDMGKGVPRKVRDSTWTRTCGQWETDWPPGIRLSSEKIRFT